MKKGKAGEPRFEYQRAMRGREGSKPTYLKWLEDRFVTLSYAHLHPDETERAEMDGEEAANMIAQRTYDVACLAERFEVPGPKGHYCGNGHHLAQRVYAFAKAEFLRGWIAKIGNPLVDGGLKMDHGG